jgi:two-component system CheB/CheR fusion protein
VRRHVKVLIADDNQDAAWALAALLEAAGHESAFALSGPEAIALAERMQPDVAVLDISMPGMNGIEVAQRLRAMPWATGLAVIALTGWGGERAGLCPSDQDFDAHLSKPVSAVQLGATMAQALARRRGGEQR